MLNVKYSDIDYDHAYLNEHCRHEDWAIELLLKRYIRINDDVLDLGSGTGFVKRLIWNKCNLTQVDLDKEFCGEFGAIWGDAYKVLKAVEVNEFDVITATFSINYMHPFTIWRMLKKCGRNVIVVMYDRPFLEGSESYYAGNKKLFTRLHRAKQFVINGIIWLLRKNIVYDKNLLGEPYYRVVILERKGR